MVGATANPTVRLPRTRPAPAEAAERSRSDRRARGGKTDVLHGQDQPYGDRSPQAGTPRRPRPVRPYNVDESVAAELMTLTREAREQGWWTQYEDLNLSP